MKKKITVALLSCSILFTSFLTSCLGSFNAFNGLKDWNQSLTDSKFVNQILFWVLWIVPVYSLFMLGDLIIFNLLEFWTGDNPIGMKEGDMQEQYLTYKGKEYRMVATQNRLDVYDLDGNLINGLLYSSIDKTWSLDVNGEVKKIVSLESINPYDADFKVYNPECEEGMQFSMSAAEFNTKPQLLKW